MFRINASGHDESGAACGRPENADKFTRHYTDKLERAKGDIIRVNRLGMDDAEYAIITFGCSTRPARAAMKEARGRGVKAGLLQLITIWPFATDEVREALRGVKGVIVPEMNLGQVIGEVQRLNDTGTPVLGVNRVDSQIITPGQILEKLGELAL